MTPRSRVVALALILALASATDRTLAHAQTVRVEAPSRAPAVAEPARFSLGAGLGFAVDVGGAGLTAVGSTSPRLAVTPTGIALFELAVTRAVRLMLGLSGSYSKKGDVDSVKPDTSSDATWLLGAGVGVRWVLNPGGVVELSPALLLGVHGGHTKGMQGMVREDNGVLYQTRTDDASLGFDGRLGIVLERALLPSLQLRFEAYFLRAGVERTAQRINGLTTRTERVIVGWGFAPSLILRLSI